MKTLCVFITAVSLLLFIIITPVYCQVVVTGHISAEIVESISARSPESVILNIRSEMKSADNRTISSNKSNLNVGSIDLGNFRIHNHNNTIYDFVGEQSALFNNRGDRLIVNPYVDDLFLFNLEPGINTVPIKGKTIFPDNTPLAVPDMYKGNYKLMIAYN